MTNVDLDTFYTRLEDLMVCITTTKDKTLARELLDQMFADYSPVEDLIPQDSYVLLYEADHYLKGTERLSALTDSYWDDWRKRKGFDKNT